MRVSKPREYSEIYSNTNAFVRKDHDSFFPVRTEKCSMLDPSLSAGSLVAFCTLLEMGSAPFVPQMGLPSISYTGPWVLPSSAIDMQATKVSFHNPILY